MYKTTNTKIKNIDATIDDMAMDEHDKLFVKKRKPAGQSLSERVEKVSA